MSRAVFNAEATADAANIADLADFGSGIGVGAAIDIKICVFGFDLDDLTRTGTDTGPAGDTLLRVYSGDAMVNLNGPIFAGAHTVAEAETAMTAAPRSAIKAIRCRTAIGTAILIEHADVLVAALAVYEGDFRNIGRRRLAKESGHLGRRFRPTGRTAVKSLIFAAGQCTGVALTAGVTTATAVGARQNLQELFLALIRLH